MHVPLDEVANYARFQEAAGAAFSIASNLLDGQGIAILAESGAGPRVVRSSGIPTGILPEGAVISAADGMAGLLSRAYEQGPLLSDASGVIAGLYTGGIAIAPIVLQDGRPFGAMIALPNADADWNHKQLDVLSSLATLIAFAVESELRRGRDRLTGLSTRTTFDDHLAIEVARSRRNGTWLAVLLIDFDFPDTSPARSESWWLTQISGRLQSSVRRGDTVARVGPREIAVLVPDLRDGDSARRVATALIELLSDPLPSCNAALALSPSIGVSLAPANGFNPRELFDGAVQAMKHVRSKGGDAYELYSNVRVVNPDRTHQT